MDLRKLKTLVDLVSESNISELEITEAEGKVRIVKSGPAPLGAAPMHPYMVPMNAPPAGAVVEAQAAVTPAAAAPAPHCLRKPSRRKAYELFTVDQASV